MQPVIRLAVLGAAIAALGGCATYQPSPLDPRAELQAQRDGQVLLLEVTRGRSGAGGEPSSEFHMEDGLDESEVVAVALKLNLSLRTARAEAGQAQALLVTTGQWPNPEVGVGFRPGISGSSGYVFEADALFQLLRPGEREARRTAATARVDEVDASIAAAEQALVAEVRQQRLAVLAADRAAALMQEAVELRQRSLDLVRTQRRIGEGTELALSATELDLAEARRELRKATGERDVALRDLNRLLGLPPDYAMNLNGLGQPLPITIFEDVSDEELDRRLLAGRLELRAKEAAYRQAEQELRVAVSEQYPRLGLGPSFERELEGDASLGLGLSLELPLLNRNEGAIAEKRAARDRVRAEYRGLLHTLRAEAFAARAALRLAKAEVDTQEAEVLPVLRRNLDLFERAYRAGELNIIDWITAQQRATNARREHLNALVEYRRALIKLEASAGQPLSSPTTAPSTRTTHN